MAPLKRKVYLAVIKEGRSYLRNLRTEIPSTAEQENWSGLNEIMNSIQTPIEHSERRRNLN